MQPIYVTDGTELHTVMTADGNADWRLDDVETVDGVYSGWRVLVRIYDDKEMSVSSNMIHLLLLGLT